MERIAVVDARSPWALRRVGAVALFARIPRLAKRAGFSRALVVCGDQLEGARRELAFRPAQIPVDLVAEEPATLPAGEVTRFDGRSLYVSTDEPPLMVIADEATLAEANRTMWRRIRKTMYQDGVFAWFVQRPAAMPMLRLLVKTRVMPNHVTVFGMLCGLSTGVIAAYGHFRAAFLMYFFTSLMDCVDGDIARIRLDSSKWGEWLDTITDDAATLAATFGVTIGLAATTSYPWVLPLGLFAGFAGIVNAAILYRYLATTPGVIDVARFPWWFMGDADKPVTKAASAPKGDGIGEYLQYLGRRDFHVFLMLTLPFFGLVWGNYAWFVMWHTVHLVMLAVHTVVTRKRRKQKSLAVAS